MAVVNFIEPKVKFAATRPVRLLMDSKRTESLNAIKEGDYIYFMPEFFTGSTDFQQTPFGILPAGYAHLGVLNSMLNHDWLTPVDFSMGLAIIMAVLGALLAIQVSALGFAVAAVAGSGLWVSICFLSFAYQGLVFPLELPLIGFLGPLISIFVEKSRVGEKKSLFIRHALDGAIQPKKLENLARVPQKLNLEARERVISVMFIDIVGFSLMAENQLPRIAFDSLKGHVRWYCENRS